MPQLPTLKRILPALLMPRRRRPRASGASGSAPGAARGAGARTALPSTAQPTADTADAAGGGRRRRARPPSKEVAAEPTIRKLHDRMVSLGVGEEEARATVERASLKLRKSRAAVAQKEAALQEKSARTLAKIEAKKVQIETFRAKARREERQRAFLASIPMVLWWVRTHSTFSDQIYERRAGRCLTGAVRATLERRRTQKETYIEIAVGRLGWLFRLQTRAFRRRFHTDKVKEAIAGGLFGPVLASCHGRAATAVTAADMQREMLAFRVRYTVLRFPAAVRKAQRVVRDFLACKRERLASMYVCRLLIKHRAREAAERAARRAEMGLDAEIGEGVACASTQAPGRHPSFAATQPKRGGPPSAMPKGGKLLQTTITHMDEISLAETKLHAMNRQVLRKIRAMEQRFNLTQFPVDSDEEDELAMVLLPDASTAGGTAAAAAAAVHNQQARLVTQRRMSQVHCLEELSAELARRRKAHVIQASRLHRDAHEDYTMHSASYAGIVDADAMRKIVRLDAKKDLGVHLARAKMCTFGSKPQWPMFALYTAMVADGTPAPLQPSEES